MKSIAKNVISFLSSTIIGGLFFLVPLFAITLIFGKIWLKMTGVGTKLSVMLGINSFYGIGGGPLMTSFIILSICLVSGLLIKLTLFQRFRNWIDHLLGKYIPGYEFYKLTLEKKISKVPDERPTILLTMEGVGQPGVIVEELADGRKVVFVPSKPGTTEGQVYVVQESALTRLQVDETNLNKVLSKQGHGLREILQ
jgi:uncharacterized membrane protein